MRRCRLGILGLIFGVAIVPGCGLRFAPFLVLPSPPRVSVVFQCPFVHSSIRSSDGRLSAKSIQHL